MLPTLGRIVHYRGKLGVQAMRAAVVVMDWESWKRDGDVAALDSPSHVHLRVFSPSDEGGFTEYNVPYFGEELFEWQSIPPGTWTWPARVS
jgi:hypothetical protein